VGAQVMRHQLRAEARSVNRKEDLLATMGEARGVNEREGSVNGYGLSSEAVGERSTMKFAAKGVKQNHLSLF
ncbi:MAG: hypothetical protein RMK89_10290, partial [Armatimonadota bacterium]|nr:hypothetical protein [Armatimonadota bacterium]MDW8143837.1 hypothetical protein [Armatimonadota bacterium]